MRNKRLRNPLVTALGALMILGVSVATASSNAAPTANIENASGVTDTDAIEAGDQTGSDSEGTEGAETEGAETEGAADAAAQHADCLKVGIDDAVTPNVQYDDETGACSLDSGGTDTEGE